MKTYLRLRCHLPLGMDDELPGLVACLPILGIEIEESGADAVTAAIYTETAQSDALSRLAGVLADRGASDVQISKCRMQDWLRGYRDTVRPFAIGDRWWIDPHPALPSGAPDGRRRLVVEPRTAFGSGSHESTQLMLLALEEIEVYGADVLDVGTGSGILALAADSLGAQRVVALDIDENAIWVARQVLAQQEWSPRVELVLGPVSCISAAEFQVVLCNMVFSNFGPLLDELSGVLATNGEIILAGLLEAEIGAVAGALESAGLETTRRRVLGEWASLAATPVDR